MWSPRFRKKKQVRWDDHTEATKAAGLVSMAREPGSCGRYCCTRGCRERLQVCRLLAPTLSQHWFWFVWLTPLKQRVLPSSSSSSLLCVCECVWLVAAGGRGSFIGAPGPRRRAGAAQAPDWPAGRVRGEGAALLHTNARHEPAVSTHVTHQPPPPLRHHDITIIFITCCLPRHHHSSWSSCGITSPR